MRTIAAALALALATPAQAFFRPGDFQPVAQSGGEISQGHAYQCLIQIDFPESRPDLVTVTYTDSAACATADALAIRYFLAGAYCSYGDGSAADNLRCIRSPAPALAEEAGPFSKAAGPCQIGIRFDSIRPQGLEIHWPGGCERAPVLLAARYATSAVLCARTTHCVSGPASADPDPDPKYYAPRGGPAGGKALPTR